MPKTVERLYNYILNKFNKRTFGWLYILNQTTPCIIYGTINRMFFFNNNTKTEK